MAERERDSGRDGTRDRELGERWRGRDKGSSARKVERTRREREGENWQR